MSLASLPNPFQIQYRGPVPTALKRASQSVAFTHQHAFNPSTNNYFLFSRSVCHLCDPQSRCIGTGNGGNILIEPHLGLGLNERMTVLLEKAMRRVSSLTTRKQNEMARFVLAELDSETKWESSFKASQDELSALAAGALAERRQGKTRNLDLVHDF